MKADILCNEIDAGKYDDLFLDIYIDSNSLVYQKKRYVGALKSFIDEYGNSEIKIFSAPGRSEIGGNHTDHQHGEVLAASINLDAIGIVKKTDNMKVTIISKGYEKFFIDLDDLELKEEDIGSSLALIKGVLAGFLKYNKKIGGFDAYITSDVLIGAGLSSSAAYENLIGVILSHLYNEGNVSASQIAIIGQFAENVYFKKPCGLMDQMASSVGNMVYIDFANQNDLKVMKVNVDFDKYGYSLCITDTKGSHADLTDEYAAVTSEMKSIANFFKKDVLLGITVDDILENINTLRKETSDRSILRAIHFINENKRVSLEVKALEDGNIDTFLQLVRMSGNSSYKYLQNVYSNKDINHQNVSLALALSEDYLKDNGVCRVHGGGFAGTIQAFVKKEFVEGYKKRMDNVFGKGSCTELKIRKYGGMKII